MTIPHRALLQIAVVCEFPTLLGGERSLLAIERTLLNQDCELTWLAPGAGPLADELRRRGSRFIPFAIRDNEGRLLPESVSLTSLNEILHEASPDILHGNSLAMARWLGRNAIRFDRPTTGHIRDIVRLSRSAVDDVNRNHKLIAVSQATRDYHIHIAQGVDASRVSVVYNGIDADEFAAATTTRVDLRSQLGLPANAFLVATIGQIGLRKGQTVFAEAAVAAQRVIPTEGRPIHFLLIGERHSQKDESQAFDAQIDATISAAAMQRQFHRLGYRHDVPSILQQVNVVVHPARQEPLGRVLLEAAAAGRAIIATDVGGTREILTHQVSALLVAADDADAIVQSILRLWLDDGLQQRLGESARETVRSLFTLEQCATGCLDVWKRAMKVVAPFT